MIGCTDVPSVIHAAGHLQPLHAVVYPLCRDHCVDRSLVQRNGACSPEDEAHQALKSSYIHVHDTTEPSQKGFPEASNTLMRATAVDKHIVVIKAGMRVGGEGCDHRGLQATAARQALQAL